MGMDGTRGRTAAMMRRAQASPAWEAPFLDALALGGNVAGAAEAAGICAGTAHRRRRRHPSFGYACTAAVAAYRATLAAAQLARELAGGAGPVRRGFGEMTANGVVRGALTGKVMRAGAGKMRAPAEDRFLSALAGCANVRLAAKAAGYSATAFYQRRLRDDGFRARWDDAARTAQAGLEAMLMAAAARALDPAGATEAPGDWLDEAGMTPPVSVSEALHILKLHGGKPAGRARWQRPPRPLAEVQDSILKKLEAIERLDRREKLAAGWREDGETMIPPDWLRPGEVGPCPKCGAAWGGKP